MKYFFGLVFIAIGYLVGSFNPAYFIGKLIYKKDLREIGSGNLGATNCSRVFGRIWFAPVFIIDSLKALFVMWLCNATAPIAVPLAGLAVIVGHSFPFYLDYKGGKSVSATAGYLIGIGIFSGDIWFQIVTPGLFFLLTLGLTRIVSLSSIVMVLSAAIVGLMTAPNALTKICLIAIAALVIYRHWPNVQRMIRKKEPKVTWISEK